MSAFDSDAPDRGSMYSPPKSTFPSQMKISDPARTLLIVNDDLTVRQLLTQLLSGEGFQVLQAENPAEALRMAGEAAAIHLLLTGFAIAGGNGLDLARQFRTMHPKAPVLMISGSMPERLDKVADLEHVQILGEPFEFDELCHNVRTLMDAVAPLPRRIQ